MTRFIAIALCLLAATAAAQPAVDYYHDAAQLYIAEDNAAAEEAALAGLALAPDDDKLRALLDKIRERNEQQGQQGNDGEQEDTENEQTQQGEGQQQDQNASGEPQPGDEGPQQQEPGGEPGQQPPEGSQDEPPPDEREGEMGAEGEPGENAQGGGEATPFDVKPGEMSRAEAERILRAIQTDELELLRDVQRRRARPRYVEKDW